MASKETSSGNRVCLVCLETRDTLKVVPECKHVCCRGCLSKHLERQEPSTKSFPCPTCHVQSRLPDEGIDGLSDYDDQLHEEKTLGKETEGGRVSKGTETCGQGHECQTCRFTKGTVVEAANLCYDCGHVGFCRDCTKIHAKNPATACHVVRSLESGKKRTDVVCTKHKNLLNSFCCTCSQLCCYVCIFLEHGDHDVKTIADAFRSLVDDLKKTTDEQQQRSSTMKKYEGQLKVLNASEVSRRRDLLVQEIENHAEKCIENIIKHKEALKEEVVSKYKVVREVSDWIGKMPALPHLDKVVLKAKQMLLNAEPHPDDLPQLVEMLRGVTEARIDKHIDDALLGGYWEGYRSLSQNPAHFVPTVTDNIGAMTFEGRTISVENATMVFEKKLEVDNDDKFIPFVANLGNNLYAVAHPILRGQASVAIDVYKYPGELQRTITDHVPRFYDMVATPAGDIAVLSKGTEEGSCSVRLFDPENGDIRATKDFPVRGALSFAVNLQHQFAFLSYDGRKVVTLFNEDGSEVLKHRFDEQKGFKDACRIRCSARHIFIKGQKGFVVYEQKGNKLVMGTSRSGADCTDISVNYFNETIAHCDGNSLHALFIERLRLHQNQLIDRSYDWLMTRSKENADKESRLSLGDNHMVISYGQTLEVYTLPQQ